MKIRNVEMVSTKDEGYRNYVRAMIAKSRKKTAMRATESKVEPDLIMAASRYLEYLVRRKLGGSDSNRVIAYEINDGFGWSQCYLECDVVRLKEGVLSVTEIKASSNNGRSTYKGCKQLKRIYDILKEEYSKISLQVVLVDYSKEESQSREFTFCDVPISVTSYPLNEVLSYADANGIRYDANTIYAAQQSALIKKQKSFEQWQKRIDVLKSKIQQPDEGHDNSSDFANLLSQALASFPSYSMQ